MIRWIRGSKTIAIFPTSVIPAERAIDILSFFDICRSHIEPTDILEFTGYANFEDNLVYLPPAHYRAPQLHTSYSERAPILPGSALWTHSMPLSESGSKPSSTPGFLLPAGNVSFENFYLHTRCANPLLDGCLIGWSVSTGTAQSNSVSFKNCILDGQHDCEVLLYAWYTGNKTITMEDTTLKYSRLGIACLAATGAGNQNINLTRVRGYGNANGSRSQSSFSALSEVSGGALTMLANRKGNNVLVDCESESIGITEQYSPYGCARIACLFTNWYFSTPGITNWNIIGCKSHYTAGAENIRNNYDLRGTAHTLTIDRLLGQGSGGDYDPYTP